MRKDRQEELPGMPGHGSMEASAHRFEFVGEFIKNPQSIKGEMAVAQFLFQCPLNGVTDDASSAIKNLLGKTVTVMVCSTECNRYSAHKAREVADMQKRSTKAKKQDDEANSAVEKISAATITNGDYMHTDGHRFLIVEADDNGTPYWQHVCILADGTDWPDGVVMIKDHFDTQSEALDRLKEWGEKHGYEKVPPIGYGRVYESKAKGAGLIKLAWNVTTDTFQGFFATDKECDDAGFIPDLAGGYGVGHEQDAQNQLDAWAAKRSLFVVGYIAFADIAPKTTLEQVAEQVDDLKGAIVDEAARVGISFRDADGVVYTVEESRDGFAIFGRHPERDTVAIELSEDDRKTIESATERMCLMATEKEWVAVDTEDQQEPEAEATLEPEAEAEPEAETPAGEPAAEEPTTEASDEADSQAADSGEPEAEEPKRDCNHDCMRCNTEECSDRTEECDPFALVPEHPDSPNAAPAQEESAAEPTGDAPAESDGKTNVQRLQEMFTNGAKQGEPKIQIKPEHKIVGSRGGPINVMYVHEDGSKVHIMGKGDVDAGIVNEKYDIVG